MFVIHALAATTLLAACSAAPGADAALRDAVRTADRVAISVVEEADPAPPEPVVLEGADTVADLLGTLHLAADPATPPCACAGQYRLVFRRQNVPLAEVVVHHGNVLHWRDGKWDTPMAMDDASVRALPGWLADHGFPHLEHVEEKRRDRARKASRDRVRFLAAFPASVRDAMTRTELQFGGPQHDRARAEVADAIIAACDGPVPAMEAVLRAVGGLENPWSANGAHVMAARAVGGRVEDAAFRTAVARIGEDDRERWLGAAWFLFEQNGLDRLAPDARDLVLAHAAGEVLASDLDGPRQRVLRALAVRGDAAGASVRALLRHAATGRAGPPRAADAYGEDPDVPAAATLALARLRDPGAAALATKGLAMLADDTTPDAAAYRIALALGGANDRLRPADFAHASYTLGYAGIAAVERLGTREAVDTLVEGAFEHPWALVNSEAVLAFQRLTGTDFTTGSKFMPLRYRPECAKWWKASRETFGSPSRSRKD